MRPGGCGAVTLRAMVRLALRALCLLPPTSSFEGVTGRCQRRGQGEPEGDNGAEYRSRTARVPASAKARKGLAPVGPWSLARLSEGGGARRGGVTARGAKYERKGNLWGVQKRESVPIVALGRNALPQPGRGGGGSLALGEQVRGLAVPGYQLKAATADRKGAVGRPGGMGL